MLTDQSGPLSSLQNPRIKQIVKLRERKERDETHLFIIEGYRELIRACDANFPIDSLYLCQELFLGENENQLIASLKNKGTKVFPCTPAVFHKISYRDRPDGLLAVTAQQSSSLHTLDGLLKGVKNPFLVVAEAIEKPGNLGTILRSSDAVNLNALIVCDKCTDIHNPNVVRASVGTLFTVPVIEAKGEETLAFLKKRGILIVAATPSAITEFTEANLKGPIAIAVGTEQLGLSKAWMEQADIQVKIPMCGVADSLNVAMATTLLLYEAKRQRK